MSIASEISRLNTAKANLKTVIERKGIPVSSSDRLDDYSFLVDSIATGSGGSLPEQPPMKRVNFMDYDGTVLHSYTSNEFALLSGLPENPTHSGLTAQGWNWTRQQIVSYLSNYPESVMNVGQMYVTDDGKTRIYITINKERPEIKFSYIPHGTIVIDWGDETEPSTDTYENSNSRSIYHEYSSSGDYVITVTVTDGYFELAQGIISPPSKAAGNADEYYRSCIKKIEIGSNAYISTNTNVFGFCGFLESITMPSWINTIGGFNRCYSLKYITIPSEVEEIPDSCFSECESLTGVSLPYEVTSIGSSAFSMCVSLLNITIPQGVTAINSSTFANCRSLTQIVMPSEVTSIGNNAFNYCYLVKNVTMSSKVESIGNSAFTGCTSLRTLFIPQSVTSIGTSAFSSCSALRYVTISSGITTITQSAFSYCKNILNITIPSGVTSIEYNAFNYCTAMKEIHVLPTTPTSLGSNVFYGRSNDLIIYVPAESLDAYKTASGWSSYASSIQAEPD